MLSRIVKVCLLIFLITIFSACSLLLGIRDPELLSDQEILAEAEIQAITKSVYRLDTAYMDFLKSTYTTDSIAIKNHYQPLQALYFDNTGTLRSWHINCLVPGYPQLNWNHQNAFNSFPPYTTAIPDTLYTFQRVSKLFFPVRSEKTELLPDYTILIFWNKFMRKHSKNLVNTVKSNLALAPDSIKYNVIYINNDSFFECMYRK
jgi:hypothetical protein